jgi:hypothetical protein
MAAAACQSGDTCSPPEAGVWIPLLLGALAVGLGVACWRVAVHARRANNRRPTVIAAVIGGVGVLCFCLLLSTFRHYGGNQQAGQGGSEYACDAWWYQIDTPAGAANGDDAPSPHCRQAAINAIGPAVGESVAVGVVAGAALFGLLTFRRRRFDRELATVVAGQTDGP